MFQAFVFSLEAGVSKGCPVNSPSTFEKLNDGRLIMVWTVRPDGRYGMDFAGFGAEDYEWLSPYTYIDSDGNFTMPFKLYSIGYQCFGGCRLREETK